MPTKEKARKKRKGNKLPKVFTRTSFEAIAHSQAMHIAEILEMHKKGLINEHDYFFTLDGLKKIGYATYKGGQANLRLHDNPLGKWANDVGTEDARLMITNAFTT